MEDSVTAGFSRGLALATGLPVALCSAFLKEMVSVVSVTHLLIPFTIRTHEAVPSRNRPEFQYREFLTKTDPYIQDSGDFRISDFPPSCSRCF